MSKLQSTVEHVLENFAFGIEVIAALILIVGSLKFLVLVARVRFGGGARLRSAFTEARRDLAVFILAGLEFLIVADILFTIVNRTLEDVIVLAVIASVRTLISVFLNKELKELKELDSGESS